MLLFARPSSKEDTIIHQRSSDFISIYRCTWPLWYRNITAIPSSMVVSSSLPLFQGGSVINLIPLFEEGLYQRHSLFQGIFVSSSLFLLARKVCIIITVPPWEEGLFELHQACHGSVQTLLETEVWSTYQQLAHWYSHTRVL